MRPIGMQSRRVLLGVLLIIGATGCGREASPSTPAPPSPNASPSATSAAPQPSGAADRGLLAYPAMGRDPTGLQIFLFDPATGRHEQATRIAPEDAVPQPVGALGPAITCGGGIYDLTWSPDGRRLAFTYAPGCDGVIFVLDVASRAVGRLADGRSPTWSPDGQHIAFSQNRPFMPCGIGCGADPGPWDILVASVVAGGGIEPLMSSEAGFSAHAPSWSPTGEWIAFGGVDGAVDPHGERPQIYLVRPDGSELRVVGAGNVARWSPDGRRLAVDGNEAVVVLSLEQDAEPIELGSGYGTAWSPDGDRIAVGDFLMDDDGMMAPIVRIVDLDGGGEPIELDGGLLDWSPDGDGMLIWSHDEDGRVRIESFDLATADREEIVNMGFEMGPASAAWQPAVP